MAKNRPKDAYVAVKEMRELLADWLDANDKSSKTVARVMRLLEIVDAELRGHRIGQAMTARPRKETRYTVENSSAGPVLTEGKTGEKSPPFRVPKVIYDLVAEVLADSPKPMRFEDILAEVSKKAAAPPGDFQCRVILRFWMSADPPLIARGRSMYHPISRNTFASTARERWRTAASSDSS